MIPRQKQYQRLLHISLKGAYNGPRAVDDAGNVEDGHWQGNCAYKPMDDKVLNQVLPRTGVGLHSQRL